MELLTKIDKPFTIQEAFERIYSYLTHPEAQRCYDEDMGVCCYRFQPDQKELACAVGCCFPSDERYNKLFKARFRIGGLIDKETELLEEIFENVSDDPYYISFLEKLQDLHDDHQMWVEEGRMKSKLKALGRWHQLDVTNCA